VADAVAEAVADDAEVEAGDTAGAASPYRVELYHLVADPLEQHDLAAAEPQKTAVMLRRLEEWQRRMGAAVSGECDADSVDEERLQQLRDLGYIQ
jgi:hypothetical protein